MDDLSLEDDEEEEEAQHDVAQVAQDVVERTARGRRGQQGSFSFSLPPSNERSRAERLVGVSG